MHEDSVIDWMRRIVNVRHYMATPVEEAVLINLFEGFRFGPSLANHQPWEILLLDDDQKQRVVEATLDPLFTAGTHSGQKWIADVPVAFVVMIDLRRSEARIGEGGVLISMEDVFSAIQNLRLLAVMHGLASSVVREFDVERLKDVLHIPNTYLPAAIITIGYPSDQIEQPPLLKVDEIVHKGVVE